jgi:hypothetical protein
MTAISGREEKEKAYDRARMAVLQKQIAQAAEFIPALREFLGLDPRHDQWRLRRRP